MPKECLKQNEYFTLTQFQLGKTGGSNLVNHKVSHIDRPLLSYINIHCLHPASPTHQTALPQKWCKLFLPSLWIPTEGKNFLCEINVKVTVFNFLSFLCMVTLITK